LKVTVREALSFGGLVDGRVIAGSGGIDNVVESVTVLEVVEPDSRQWNLPNQLHITAFYAIRDQVQAQIAMIRSLHEGGCSGLVLCHVGNVMKDVHLDLIAVCDRLDFPLVVVPPEVTYIEILVPIVNRILLISNEKNQLALEIQEELLRKVINEERLDSIAQFVGKKLETAIVIVDTLAGVVAQYGSNDEEVRRIWEALRASGETAFSVKAFTGIHVEKDYHVYPIVIEEMRYGYLVCEITGRDEEYVLLMLKHAAVACSLLVTQRHRRSTIRQMYRNELIKELVEEGSLRNREELLRVASSVGWRLDCPGSLLLLEADGSEETEILRLFNQFCIRNGLPVHFGSRNGLYLIFLAPGIDAFEIASLLLHAVEEHSKPAGAVHVTIGVSGPIGDLEEIPAVYRTTVDALVLGKRLFPDQKIHESTKMAFLPDLYRHTRDSRYRKTAQSLLEPLLDYDREHNQDLVATLEALLLQGRNMQHIADTLHIHRNTLNYRRNKIIELLGIDPFTGFESMNYVLALFVLKF
jgi:PucR family transcriptional regulator, purine catabolism regulatory protein